MRNWKVWLASGGLLAAAIAAGVLLLAPSAVGQGCHLASKQPDEPLEMNTAVEGDLAKTVVQEKEVYVCEDQSGIPFRTVDLETFLEIVERAGANATSVVERRAEVAECSKRFASAGGTVNCGGKTLSLGAPVTAPLSNCQPAATQLGDPVEMNTVAFTSPSGTRLIKTIKVEKEVFSCPNNVRADLYVFRKIVQRRTTTSAGTPTYRPVQRNFEGIVCRKSTFPVAEVQGCDRVQIGALT
jgi:hypothetical protein